jgi:hypothetical protein
MKPPTWIDLPGSVLRTLHSAWTDWLLEAPPEVADAMADRCCGMNFRRFALALSAERLTVTQRLTDDDQLLIGIAVPTTDGKPWQLFELPPSHTGMSLEFLMRLSTHHIDEQLSQMLGGGTT